MKDNNLLKSKVINATKWSSITEIVVKLVSPITNMILARILAPEAFGVVATIVMLISFVEMFTDSGFQKYLIQHDFKSERAKYKYANVAFWTNFIISFVLWGIIFLFSDHIAVLVGNPGLGNVLTIACIQLPLTSFSSIQTALYKRDLDFKPLFIARVISVCVPIVVTIPLAFMGLSYWALIIGTIVMQFSNAIILTIKSKWKPQLFYSVKILKKMFSFSIWSLIEAVSIWLSVWADTFIIVYFFNQYYIGLYKTSTSMVNTLMLLITSVTLPVLFSALSRLQNDENQFNLMFYKFQRITSILVFPFGVGLYLYSDLATQIMLGNQWLEGSTIIGIWALTNSIKIIFCNLSSEVYRAKGRPKLSFLAQILHLVILVPTCIISSSFGFWQLVYARSWIQMQFVIVHFILMKFAIGIPILSTVRNVLPTAISAILMGIFGYSLQFISEGNFWSLISIMLCSLFYFTVLFAFPSMRKQILMIIHKIIPRFKKKTIING